MISIIDSEQDKENITLTSTATSYFYKSLTKAVPEFRAYKKSSLPVPHLWNSTLEDGRKSKLLLKYF